MNATEQQIQKSVRRHIRVSLIAAGAIVALVLLSGLPAKLIVVAALVIALTVAGSGMHLFSERPAIQILIGFTVFFAFMLVSWSYEAFKDRIDGTDATTYELTTTTVQTGEAH